MASIVENKKYGENHKVQLKDKPTNVALFRKEGYRPGQSIFLITRKKVKVNKLLPLTAGNKSITLKDDKNKIVEITGSESSINCSSDIKPYLHEISSGQPSFNPCLSSTILT